MATELREATRGGGSASGRATWREGGPGKVRTRGGKSRDAEFEKKHPRAGAGRTGGGRFITAGSSGAAADAVKDRLGDLSPERVKRFQKRHGLTVDGKIGHQTAAALAGDGDASKVKTGALTDEDRRKLRTMGKRRAEEAVANANASNNGTSMQGGGAMKRCPSCNWKNKLGKTKCSHCHANLRASGDPKDKRKTEEATFDGRKHPRDRQGKFRDTRAGLIRGERQAKARDPNRRKYAQKALRDAVASGAPLPWHLAHMNEARVLVAWTAALDAHEAGNEELAAEHSRLALALEERSGLFREELHPRSRLGQFREKVIKAEQLARTRGRGRVKSRPLVSGMHIGRQLLGEAALVEFKPQAHPRDRMGRFIETLNKLGDNQTVELPGGTMVTKRVEKGRLDTYERFEVKSPDVKRPFLRGSPEFAAQTAAKTEPELKGGDDEPRHMRGMDISMDPRIAAEREAQRGQAAAMRSRFGRESAPQINVVNVKAEPTAAGIAKAERQAKSRQANRVASLGGSRATAAELRKGAADIEALPDVTEQERSTARTWRQTAERLAGEEAAGGALSDRRPSAAKLGIGGSAANPVTNASGTWHGTPHWVVRKPMPKRLKTPAKEMPAVDAVVERATTSLRDAKPVTFGSVSMQTWGGIERPITRPTTDIEAPGRAPGDRLVANADYIANVQNKLKGGHWRVSDSGQFLYVKDGQVEGIVMGVREKPGAGGHTPAPKAAPTATIGADTLEQAYERGSRAQYGGNYEVRFSQGTAVITELTNRGPKEVAQLRGGTPDQVRERIDLHARSRRRREQANLDELGRSRTAGYYKARAERRRQESERAEIQRKSPGAAAEEREFKDVQRGARDAAAAELGEPVEGHKPAAPSAAELRGQDISSLAQMIRSDWAGKINFAAKPYLDAMRSLSRVQDSYGQDTGAEIVMRFLSNSGSWRGPTAKAVKAELRRRVKTPLAEAGIRAERRAALARASGDVLLAEQFERSAQLMAAELGLVGGLDARERHAAFSRELAA